jgi:hypothetical protein
MKSFSQGLNAGILHRGFSPVNEKNATKKTGFSR